MKGDPDGPRQANQGGAPLHPGGGANQHPAGSAREEGTSPRLSAVPDALGPLVGYRVWMVKTTDGLWPTAIQEFGPWKGEAAECSKGSMGGMFWGYMGVTSHDSPAPAQSCRCGYYVGRYPVYTPNGANPNWAGVTDDPPQWAKALRRFQTIAGEAKIWGTVYEYERGYRAEFAKPTALYRLWHPQHDKRASQIAARYDVPIVEPPPELAAVVEEEYRAAREREEAMLAAMRKRLRQERIAINAFRAGVVILGGVIGYGVWLAVDYVRGL